MVTGLGGVFIKASDPKFLARWYDDNLGIGFGKTLHFSFKWRKQTDTAYIAHTVYSFFRDDTGYFYPGNNDIMLNLRVDNLDELRIQLKNDGAYVIDKVESYEYGRFGWVIDPAGNKLELWEAIDAGFDDRESTMDLGAVTGLGGAYLKCPQPEKLMNWYSKHFGLFFRQFTHEFTWRDLYDKQMEGRTTLTFFPDDSAYFSPSDKPYMLNFRVYDLDGLLRNLRGSDVVILNKREQYAHGKFGWIMDPEGNKIELWEPNLVKAG